MSTSDPTAELMKADLYQMLDIEPSADLKLIRRAYRKEALKCHPDKNPDDPGAAELFQKLSKILEILGDPETRSVYDKLLRARKCAQLREQAYDSQRKKFKSDLQARELAATAPVSAASTAAADSQLLQRTIDRLRRENSQLLREEQQLMREQLLREQQQLSTAAGGDDDSAADACFQVRVRCVNPKQCLDRESVTQLLAKYGSVQLAVVSRKRPGSALVEFDSAHSAQLAARLENGSASQPLRVTLVQKPNHHQQQQHASPADSSFGSQAQSLEAFESVVLQNLQRAQEKLENGKRNSQPD